MRIATWNVNSVRSRIDRVEALLQRHDIDVLALQETKARDDQFPVMGLSVLGYEVASVGYDQWNGVAIVSRVGLDDVQVGFEGMPSWSDADRGAGDRRDVWRRTGVVALRPQRPLPWRPAPGTTSSLGSKALNVVAAAWVDTPTARSSATGTSPRRTTTSGTSRRSPRART